MTVANLIAQKRTRSTSLLYPTRIIPSARSLSRYCRLGMRAFLRTKRERPVWHDRARIAGRLVSPESISLASPVAGHTRRRPRHRISRGRRFEKRAGRFQFHVSLFFLISTVNLLIIPRDLSLPSREERAPGKLRIGDSRLDNTLSSRACREPVASRRQSPGH